MCDLHISIQKERSHRVGWSWKASWRRWHFNRGKVLMEKLCVRQGDFLFSSKCLRLEDNVSSGRKHTKQREKNNKRDQAPCDLQNDVKRNRMFILVHYKPHLRCETWDLSLCICADHIRRGTAPKGLTCWGRWYEEVGALETPHTLKYKSFEW